MAILFLYYFVIITCSPLICAPLILPHLLAPLYLRPLYLRPSLASMHSVAWGTRIRRSLGISLPVVLQMP